MLTQMLPWKARCVWNLGTFSVMDHPSVTLKFFPRCRQRGETWWMPRRVSDISAPIDPCNMSDTTWHICASVMPHPSSHSSFFPSYVFLILICQKSLRKRVKNIVQSGGRIERLFKVTGLRWNLKPTSLFCQRRPGWAAGLPARFALLLSGQNDTITVSCQNRRHKQDVWWWTFIALKRFLAGPLMLMHNRCFLVFTAVVDKWFTSAAPEKVRWWREGVYVPRPRSFLTALLFKSGFRYLDD